MKNLLLITTLFLILIAACQQKKSEDEQKLSEEITSTFDSSSLPTTEITDDENQTFSLTYQFKPGESFKYRMTVISQNEQYIEADSSMTAKVEQTIIYLIDFKILSLDEGGIAELQCTFSSINLKASANNQEVSYQSGSDIDSTEKIKFAEYESFVNIPFNIRVSKNGELKDIFKLDKILDRFLSLRGLTDSVKTEDKVTIKDQISNGSIKPLIAQMLREVPKHKMAVDSTWSYKRESMPVMVFQIKYKNIYKVAKLEMLGNEKIALVNGIVEAIVEGNQDYSEHGINYRFEKPISTASGKIYFNLDKGLIQKSRTQTHLETSYTMEMTTPQGTKKGKARETVSNTNILELL